MREPKFTPHKSFSGTRPLLLAAALAALLILFAAGCGQTGNASSNSKNNSSNPKSSASTTAPKTSSQMTTSQKTSGDATTGLSTAGPKKGGSSKKHSSKPSGAASTSPKVGRVMLNVTGDSGVKFNGSCTVNGKKETISGQVPVRQVYKVGKGKNLSCEIHKQGGNGTLRVVLKSKNGTSTYQTNSPNGVIRASLTGGTSVTQSVSQSSAVSQSSSSNSVHSSSQSVVVNQSSNR